MGRSAAAGRPPPREQADHRQGDAGLRSVRARRARAGCANRLRQSIAPSTAGPGLGAMSRRGTAIVARMASIVTAAWAKEERIRAAMGARGGSRTRLRALLDRLFRLNQLLNLLHGEDRGQKARHPLDQIRVVVRVKPRRTGEQRHADRLGLREQARAPGRAAAAAPAATRRAGAGGSSPAPLLVATTFGWSQAFPGDPAQPPVATRFCTCAGGSP